MWRHVFFVPSLILSKKKKTSIYLVSGQSSFFSLMIFYTYFWIYFFGLNSAAITCLCVTDSDASHIFHMQSRTKSEEFKWWVYFPTHVHLYIYLHRHIRFPTNFLSWVGDRLRSFKWGCTKNSWTVRQIPKLIQCAHNVLVCPHPS